LTIAFKVNHSLCGYKVFEVRVFPKRKSIVFYIDQHSPLKKQKELQTVSLLIKDASEWLQTVVKSKDAFEMGRETILIEGRNAKSKSISERLSTVTEQLI